MGSGTWRHTMSTVTTPDWHAVLAASASAHRRIAGYSLPPALDQRILDLGERKEFLSADEHAELLAWVRFTQERTVEKLEAEAALRRLVALDPSLVSNP